MRANPPKLRVSVLTLALLPLFGCQSSPPSYSADYKAKFEKRTGADEGRAKAFLREISAVPQADRATYVEQHSQDAKNLAKIPDQDLQAEYRALMTKPK